MNKNNIKSCIKAVPVMGGHAACWVKAKPNAFSGEKENAKVRSTFAAAWKQGPAAKQTAGPCPVTGFVVSYNY